MADAARVRRLSGRWGEADRASVGGKAVGVAALLRAGLTVPDSWVVPVGAEPSPEQLGELAAYAPYWAVRSSATVEDGAALSYAGMFRSELGVPAEDLAAALGRVRSSASSERVRAYRERFAADAGPPPMAVLLQPYREPVHSGVWLGRGLDEGRLEWVHGAGERLVSGGVTPEWEEWTASGPRGASAREVLTGGGEPVGVACLAAQLTLGQPADLEFAVLGSRLVWLQFRPVTAAPGTGSPGPERADEHGAHGVHGAHDMHGMHGMHNTHGVRGTAASPGTATGPALLLHTTDDPRWEPGAVLLVEQTDPDWVPLMAEASALVTAEGGMLCHAAIIARELGVPCVTGVGAAALEQLATCHTGRAVRVDGGAGVVSAAAEDGRPVPYTAKRSREG